MRWRLYSSLHRIVCVLVASRIFSYVFPGWIAKTVSRNASVFCPANRLEASATFRKHPDDVLLQKKWVWFLHQMLPFWHWTFDQHRMAAHLCLRSQMNCGNFVSQIQENHGMKQRKRFRRNWANQKPFRPLWTRWWMVWGENQRTNSCRLALALRVSTAELGHYVTLMLKCLDKPKEWVALDIRESPPETLDLSAETSLLLCCETKIRRCLAVRGLTVHSGQGGIRKLKLELRLRKLCLVTQDTQDVQRPTSKTLATTLPWSDLILLSCRWVKSAFQTE